MDPSRFCLGVCSRIDESSQRLVGVEDRPSVR